MPELPSGTVTFLFTDVEGSTKLLHELGARAYAEALAEHRRVLREAFTTHGGVEVDTQGDAFFVAFPTAPGALQAAAAALEGLAPGPIRVRMGIHTGTPHLAEEGYVGPDVNRAARIAACGHGGQVLVSATTATLLQPSNSLLLTDLGEHRLKDLSAPERIYQLGEGQFPPLSSLHKTNLPIPLTPFLGRERDRQEIGNLLAREDVRLLTLTGPGGTGKTRLALQAAGAAADAFLSGVWWVPLAPLRDPGLVLETAAQTLGAKDGLAEHVGDKRLLLLFDNFEHVIEAAGDLAALLAACPNLHLLVTSRELLQLPGEHTYPVPPLAPDEGAELFHARARAIKPDFHENGAVAAICDRLDHLPLAIELAAARVRMLSPEQLLERLSQRLDLLKAGRGVDPRQQTLRATIEWSHELLAPEEQQLLARLSVFRGGCTLEAAEEVCEADLDTLQSLVDKSLVRVRDGERFWMLETIREYAGERLEGSGEAERLRRRHAEHSLELARELPPHAPAEKEWLDTLDREHDNIRAALDRLPAQGEPELALDLAESVWRFWKMRGHQPEGRRRLETLLAAVQSATPARGHALNAAAAMAVDTADYAAGRRYAEEALAIHRQHDDAWGIARSLFMLGYSAIESGDFEAAAPLFEETCQRMSALGHEHYSGMATFNLAWAYGELGQTERARELAMENLRRAQAIGSPNLEAAALDTLARYEQDDGRLESALELKRQSLRLSRELGDVQHVLDSLSRIAHSHAHAGHAELAARLLSASLALHEGAALSVPLYQKRRRDEIIEIVREQLDEAELADAWERGKELSVDDAVALALDALD